MGFKFFSIAGFSRKLLLFLIVDAVIAGVEVVSQQRTLVTGLGLFLLRFPVSMLLAALLNAVHSSEKRF